MKIEELRLRLFELRNECGVKRQPTHKTRLEELNKILAQLFKAEHPYKLGNKLQEFAKETKIFSYGAKGNSATLNSTDYVYRVQQLSSFLRSLDRQHSEITSNKQEDRIWTKLLSDSDNGAKWVKLERYGKGMFPNPSTQWWSFSWWTSHAFQGSLNQNALKLGMYTEWIAEHPIIFRAPVEAIQQKRLAHVPTVVDAYLQPIFNPVNEEPVPRAGKTIDLSGNRLCEGVDEYVIKPLEVEYVEIKPVVDNYHDNEVSGWSRESRECLKLLISYYEEQLKMLNSAN